AVRQLLPRDSRRKAEVVLDLRTGTGLSTGCVRLYEQDAETLRGTVHRGSKARGPRPDNHHVPQRRLVDLIVEAQTVGDFLVGRISQDKLTATDEDGDLLQPDAELIEQFLNPFIP